jgi:hypothetical protein
MLKSSFGSRRSIENDPGGSGDGEGGDGFWFQVRHRDGWNVSVIQSGEGARQSRAVPDQCLRPIVGLWQTWLVRNQAAA